MDTTARTNNDVRTRIWIARAAFIVFNKIWKSKEIPRPNKLFNSNIKAVLIYGSYIWRTTTSTLQKIQTCVSKWRRDVEAEMSKAEYKWRELQARAQNRVRWKGVVDGLCSAGE